VDAREAALTNIVRRHGGVPVAGRVGLGDRRWRPSRADLKAGFSSSKPWRARMLAVITRLTGLASTIDSASHAMPAR